jgi:cytidine deaminase
MDRPEIVIGLVGPIGTSLDAVIVGLKKALDELGYNQTVIRLSDLLINAGESVPYDQAGLKVFDSENKRIQILMDAGNEMRRAMKRGDALALMTVAAIRQLRFQHHATGDVADSEKPIVNHAFVLRSLKHAKEVETLRKIYGPSFFLISAYAPEKQRLDSLTKRIAESVSHLRPDGHMGDAMKLLERDEAEVADDFGQQVRKTFWRGDAYVDTSNGSALENDILRIIQLWFGHPFHTPSKDEYMMFFASGASCRSASMGRQVGAVIADEQGSILSTGCNEVPRAKGGQYWFDDPDDARDHIPRENGAGVDSSDTMRRELLTDLLNHLNTLGHLNDNISNVRETVDALLYGDNPVMGSAEFNSLTEFQRPVHAEMAAIIDAARRGVALERSILYSTTFPCHGCARHIVAAGIRRVVYIEPYAKSLALVLHSDSISMGEAANGASRVVFEPFVGLAPRRYTEFFSLGDRKRKDSRGRAVQWKPLTASPSMGGWENRQSVINEQKYVTLLNEWQISFNNIKNEKETNSIEENISLGERT